MNKIDEIRESFFISKELLRSPVFGSIDGVWCNVAPNLFLAVIDRLMASEHCFKARRVVDELEDGFLLSLVIDVIEAGES